LPHDTIVSSGHLQLDYDETSVPVDRQYVNEPTSHGKLNAVDPFLFVNPKPHLKSVQILG
jgi:hypothetical protein